MVRGETKIVHETEEQMPLTRYRLFFWRFVRDTTRTTAPDHFTHVWWARVGCICSPTDVASADTSGSTASGPPSGSGMTQDMGVELQPVPPHVPHPSGQHNILSSSRTPSTTTPFTVPHGAPVIGSAAVGRRETGNNVCLRGGEGASGHHAVLPVRTAIATFRI